jgi:hypothetical protein
MGRSGRRQTVSSDLSPPKAARNTPEIEGTDSGRFRRPEYAACDPDKGQRTCPRPGADLGFRGIDPSFVKLVVAKVTEQAAAVEMNEAEREYLHPVAGSTAAKIGAGTFLKPTR